MLRALSSGVSGLRANQAALDVIGNNLANVNTPGFKGARTSFVDLLSQTLKGEQAPSGGRGGINPMQIGLGAALGAVRPNMAQGAVESTDNPTDLAIQGEGFFVLAENGQRVYTRAGAFALDAEGALVDAATGLRVQGLSGDVLVRQGSLMAAQATSQATFGGNLDAQAADGTTVPVTLTVRDSLGGAHTLTVTFTKNFAAAPGQWDWTVTTADPLIASLSGATGSVVFNGSGAIAAGQTGTLGITYVAAAGVNSPQTVTLDFGSAQNASPLTGFAEASTAAMTAQDGFAAGSLQAFSIAGDGTVVGVYDNGRTQTIDRLALARFANPAGLMRLGENLYRESENSGPPDIGAPGDGGRGTLIPSALERSNVDLAREFTDLVVAQRGFEAAARIIGVSDQVLQTVVNLTQ